jgi:hypothetical protein
VLSASDVSQTNFGFEFIGVARTRSVPDLLHVNPQRPLVIWQAADRDPSFPLREIVENAVKSNFILLVNAAAIRTLIGEGCRADWMTLFDFDEDNLQTIDWKVPPANFTPRRESLPVFGAEDGVDEYFRSIPCRLENRGNVGEVVEMRTSERMFVARFKQSRISVFNFDLITIDRLSGPVQWGCHKQKLLGLSWLLAQSITME